MAIDSKKLDAARPRLESERNVWMATVRPDGRPHLVPIWFVWHAERIWISTPATTVKVKNLMQNNRISVSLEDGNKPIIFEGTATLHFELADIKDAPLEGFKTKYDWDVATDSEADYCILEVQPDKLLSW